MLVFFVCHLVLRAAYFFNDDRRNFDITSKSLSEGLPPLESLIDIFEVEHALSPAFAVEHVKAPLTGVPTQSASVARWSMGPLLPVQMLRRILCSGS